MPQTGDSPETVKVLPCNTLELHFMFGEIIGLHQPDSFSGNSFHALLFAQLTDQAPTIRVSRPATV